MPKDTVIGQVHQVEEEDGMLVVKAGCTGDVLLDTGVVRQVSVSQSVSEDGNRERLKTILAKNVVHRTPENMKILETVLIITRFLHRIRRNMVRLFM